MRRQYVFGQTARLHKKGSEARYTRAGLPVHSDRKLPRLNRSPNVLLAERILNLFDQRRTGFGHPAGPQIWNAMLLFTYPGDFRLRFGSEMVMENPVAESKRRALS